MGAEGIYNVCGSLDKSSFNILCIWMYSAVPHILYYKECPIKIGSHMCMTKWRLDLSTSSHIQIIPRWKPNVGYVFFRLKHCAPRKSL